MNSSINVSAAGAPDAALPGDVELLLPFHAAGTLDRRDAARVERALAADPELAARYERVREEFGETIALNESLGAPSMRARDALFAKIDALAEADAPRRRDVPARGFGAWLSDVFAGLSPRALAFGAGAAALVIALQAGLLAGMALKESGGGFVTASATSEEGSFVSVRFAPQATAAEITRFLAENKASLVGGPGAAGLFKLRVSEQTLPEAELSARVRRLAQDPVVGFAAAAH